MKREDVKGVIPGITDEQLGKIMDLHSADIGLQKQQITTLTAERDAARSQLSEANTKLEGYDPDWRAKAEKAENDAKDQVDAMRRRFAETNAAARIQFTSAGARKAFLADLAEKKLALQEDDTLLGFDDYVASYKKSDPGAFVAEAGYPNVKDGGDPNKTPTGSTREQFAEWFNQVMK